MSDLGRDEETHSGSQGEELDDSQVCEIKHKLIFSLIYYYNYFTQLSDFGRDENTHTHSGSQGLEELDADSQVFKNNTSIYLIYSVLYYIMQRTISSKQVDEHHRLFCICKQPYDDSKYTN